MTADQLKQPIDTDALRQEFADYMVDVEPGIKARAPRLNQLETLAVVAISLFAALKEFRAEQAELQSLIARLISQSDEQEVLICEHIAAQREAEARAAWQPIETAPKDREIWAFNGEQARMVWTEGAEYALWIWADTLLCEADPEPDRPTHWMPLPKAPDATTEGGE